MPVKRKYLIPKVSVAGEDVTVDAERFDGFLTKLVSKPPKTRSELHDEPGLIMARRPKKDVRIPDKPKSAS